MVVRLPFLFTVSALLVSFAFSDSDVDWLISRPSTKSAVRQTCWVYEGKRYCGLEIGNGLISRRFVMEPAFGTLDYILNATTERGGEQSMLRTLQPEGRITIDNVEYHIGGLVQKHALPTIFLAYMNRSSLELAANESTFQLKSYKISTPEAPFKWTPGTRGSPVEYDWPPKGATLAVTFGLPNTTKHFRPQGIFTGRNNTSQRQEFELMSPRSARYWRFVCNSTYSRQPPAVAEFEFRADGDWLVNNGTQNKSIVIEWSTQGEFPGHGGQAWQAVDGNTRTVWAAVRGTHWIVFDLGREMLVDAIALTALGDSVHDPQVFEIEALVEVPVPLKHRELDLTVWYEVYDGIPLLSKWVTISMNSVVDSFGREVQSKKWHWGKPHAFREEEFDVVINTIVVETFSSTPNFGSWDLKRHGPLHPGYDWGGAASGNSPNPRLHAKTDQAHNTVCQWLDEFPISRSPVDDCDDCKDEGSVEPLLECTYELGPGAHVNPHESFASFRVFELANDNDDLTRTALARHRLTSTLAPHVSENPIFFHATNVTEEGFKVAIEQMVETGFEMLIYSFGSGFELERSDPAYLNKIKAQIDYARSRGIEVGGYDLICLERGHYGYGGNVGDEWTVVNPDSGDLTRDACFASGWYDKLTNYVGNFINQTGLSMLETDGPYGGAACAAKSHEHHHGTEDSIYRQQQLQNAFFWNMRELNVYVNQPDDFFFAGGSRTGMGYSEQQYSLPRWKDLSISRMGLYDDLYAHLPTQGWMFVPLIGYHAGGPDAEFLEHLKAYEWALAAYLGGGTAACYRGPVLYTHNQTRDVVQKWVKFYKNHRGSIIQPVQHLRRADIQGWDGWLHVNPFSLSAPRGEVGVGMLFNPTHSTLTLTLSLPLYYCGVSDVTVVRVSVNEGEFVAYNVLRDYTIRLPITMPPQSIHTVVIRK